MFYKIEFCKILAQCSVVITANQGVRAGKKIELKKTVDSAVASCPSVKHVFVMQRTDAAMNLGSKDINLTEVVWFITFYYSEQ